MEQFRQGLVNQDFGAVTIWTHIRCINDLAEAMKPHALALEDLDEAFAIELIAETGWMRDRSTSSALIVIEPVFLYQAWSQSLARLGCSQYAALWGVKLAHMSGFRDQERQS